MSGWPTDSPSARASCRPSIGYLRASVRNGGAAGCGLRPAVPVAWQRAQFLVSKASPRFSDGVRCCAETEDMATAPVASNAGRSRKRRLPRMLARSPADDIANLVEQRIPEQGLLDDRDARLVRPLAQRRTGVAGDQDCRCGDMPGAQQRNQLEPVHSRHVLVDDETAAEREVAGAQQLRPGRVAAHREALDLEREFERIANGEIIVDDDDDVAGNRRFPLVFHRSCLPSRARLAGRAGSSGTGEAALIWLKSTPAPCRSARGGYSAIRMFSARQCRGREPRR